jgi:hypothetical protein
MNENEKWWTVTAYYPLTSVSIGLVAPTEALAEEQAIEVMVHEWGEKARKYEDIDVVEQENMSWYHCEKPGIWLGEHIVCRVCDHVIGKP